MVDLFFDMFLTISKFSIFWTVQEVPGWLLGSVLGGSWGVLRGSGGVRGGAGAVLEAILQQDDFSWIFGSILGSVWAPKRGPKGNQNGTKSGPKSKAKTMSKKEASQDFLEPSWGDLRAFWKPAWGPKKHFRMGKTNTGSKFIFLRR